MTPAGKAPLYGASLLGAVLLLGWGAVGLGAPPSLPGVHEGHREIEKGFRVSLAAAARAAREDRKRGVDIVCRHVLGNLGRLT